MKKTLRTLCVTAAISSLAAFSAFAAENKQEYRQEAYAIREEMQAIDEEAKPLRELISGYAQSYRAAFGTKETRIGGAKSGRSALTADLNADEAAETDDTLAALDEVLAELEETAKAEESEEENSGAASDSDSTVADDSALNTETNSSALEKIRALRKSLSEYRLSKAEVSSEDLREEAKKLADEADFDGALEKLTEVKERKAERLESLKRSAAIWEEINALMQELR